MWGESGKSVGLVLFALLCLAGCHDRIVGQVELFGINRSDQTLCLVRTPICPATTKPARGEISTGEQIIICVDSAYIHSLPPRLTGSRDIILFAEVQPDASTGYAGPKVSSIVYLGENQRVPGRLNFTDNLAFGPVVYSGRQLKIKFTLMVLQGAESARQQSMVGVIAKLAGAAGPQYSAVTSLLASTIRDILAAQPDIVAFDYETTFFGNPADFANDSELTDSQHVPGEAPTAQPNQPPTVSQGGGQFVLLETLGWQPGARSIWKGRQPSDIYFDGSVLRDKSNRQQLPANYIVFRIVQQRSVDQ